MESREALQLIEVHLGVSLNDNERDLLTGVLEGLDGTQIHSKYFDGRIKKAHLTRNVAPKLWKKLSNEVGEKVGMRNLRGPLKRARDRFVEAPAAVPSPARPVSPLAGTAKTAPEKSSEARADITQNAVAPKLPQTVPLQDWGRSPRVVNFCGRRDVLLQVETRLRIEGCQMLAICGEAGVGKTWFAKQLAQRLIDHYDTVVWRSINSRRPPEVGYLLADLVSTITRKSYKPPVSIAHFLEVLMNHPSLVILDGIEAVLAENAVDGSYKDGFKEYETLLRELSQRSHYSCVLIVGREQPRVFSEQSGNPLICNLGLRGLDTLETQELCQARGASASPALWRQLKELCDGNPKALQLMDEMLIGACAGDVALFLDLPDQLHERTLDDQQIQFNRLSRLEQEILRQLSQLQPPVANLKTLAAMPLDDSFKARQQAHRSLIRRSLLQRCDDKPSNYIMSSLMRKYVLEQVAAESEQPIEQGIAANPCSELLSSALQQNIHARAASPASGQSSVPSLVNRSSAV